MSLTLTIGARNLTAHDDLSFSNVDPGGYEQLTATVNDASGVKVGDEVTVRCGLDIAWHGRLNEIGSRDDSGRSTVQLAALGHGAKLTDKRLSMIYADRDLTAWTGPSSARRVNLLSGAFRQVLGPVVVTDQSTPALRTAIHGAWAAAAQPIAEALYDAGPGNLIGSMQAAHAAGPGTTHADWVWSMLLATTDAITSFDGGSDLQGGASPATVTATGANKRFAVLQLYYSTAGAAGADGWEFNVDWSNVRVYGDHGLTGRGASPQGFYPGDIVGHALTHSGAGFELVADDSSTLIVGHAVYRDGVPHEQAIEAMAKLMGWHYGTWEPASVLSSTPRLFFTAPPANVTCVVSRAEITGLDAPKTRVDKLYDTARVRWTDAAGVGGITTVTLANALAQTAGVSGRVLDLDMGLGDATTATTFGGFALGLALASARGGGSGTLPAAVRLPGGGTKPACLLKAGRDRQRILDLPDSGSLTASDADRQDSFLVRRVETTVARGTPTTRVEFDGGADLLEVLQARLALAATLTG